MGEIAILDDEYKYVIQFYQYLINRHLMTKNNKTISDLPRQAKKKKQQVETKRKPTSPLVEGSEKAKKLQEKKVLKFDEDIDRVINFIFSNKGKEAIDLLKEIIFAGQYLERYEYIGWGNNQNWEGNYPIGPFEWLATQQKTKPIRNPFDLLSITYMTLQYSEQMTFEQIIAINQQLQDKFPDRYQMYILVGNISYNNYELYVAEQNYMRALQIKESQKVLEYMAWIKGQGFDQDELAIQYCNKCLYYNPNNRGALYVKAVCHDQIDQIQDLLNQLVKKFPDYYRLYTSLGYYCNNHNNDNLQARLYCDKSLAYDRYYVKAHVRKAMSLAKIRPQQARRMLNQALNFNKQSVQIYFHLGRLCYNEGNYTQEVEYFEKCLEINPLHFPSIKELADHYHYEENHEKTIQICQKYIELNPYNSEIYYYLGNALKEIDQIQGAAQSLLRSIELDPVYFKALKCLGHLYREIDQSQKALFFYKRAIQIQQTADLYFYMSLCHYQIEQYVIAKELCFKCIDMGGDENQQVFIFLGEIELENFNIGAAMGWHLKYACVEEQICTSDIMEKIVRPVSQRHIQKILDSQLQEGKDKNGIFWPLQIAIIYWEIKCQQKAFQTFELVRKMAEAMENQGQNVNQKVKHELYKFFGNPDQGYYDLISKSKFERLLQTFHKIFQNFYQKEKQESYSK